MQIKFQKKITLCVIKSFETVYEQLLDTKQQLFLKTYGRNDNILSG